MYLFELWFSLDICPGVGLLDHMVALFLGFLRSLHTVPYSDCTNLHSHQNKRFNCWSLLLSNFYIQSLPYIYIPITVKFHLISIFGICSNLNRGWVKVELCLANPFHHGLKFRFKQNLGVHRVTSILEHFESTIS